MGSQDPWLTIGDFNAVLNMEDRIGGNPVTKRDVLDFQHCVESSCSEETKFIEARIEGTQKFHFRDILVEAEDDKIKFEKIQRELQTSPRDQDIQGKEKAQYQKFIRYSYVVESFLQQRSKATWIRIGDDNSKYFFSVIKQKKLKEAVIQLRYGNDVIHIEPEEISKIFVEYYKELLGKKVVDRTRAARRIMINRPVLSTTQHMDMIKPYTNEDVRDAIFSIDGNKRSGPDGYESDFFKKAWTIVGKYVTTVVLQFLSNGK
nr:uncharacterized protein LOC104091687 [Nicotiana tomentosiformis]